MITLEDAFEVLQKMFDHRRARLLALRWYGSAADWRNEFARGYSRELYIVYLESRAWQAKREAFAEAKCRRCIFGMAEQLHHKTYARLGDELREDLEWLCALCHKIEHGKAPPLPWYLQVPMICPYDPKENDSREGIR